jgi:hypothetical protein
MVFERLNETMKIIRVTGAQKGKSPSRRRTCVTAATASSVNMEVDVSYNYLVRVLMGYALFENSPSKRQLSHVIRYSVYTAQ